MRVVFSLLGAERAAAGITYYYIYININIH